MSTESVNPEGRRQSFNPKDYNTHTDLHFDKGEGVFTLLVGQPRDTANPPFKFVVHKDLLRSQSSRFENYLERAIDDVVDLPNDNASGWVLVLGAIYDPLILFKTLPEYLQAPGGERLIQIGAMRKVIEEHEFGKLGTAVDMAIDQYTTASLPIFVKILQNIEERVDISSTGAASRWLNLPERRRHATLPLLHFIDFAHNHRIPTMLPGLFYSLLSMYSPGDLYSLEGLSMQDKLRCAVAFPYIELAVVGEARTSINPYALWSLSTYGKIKQDAIWNSLPRLFQLAGSWKELIEKRTREVHPL